MFKFKNIKITKATFNNIKFMNNLAFVVQIHVCLPSEVFGGGGGGGGDNPIYGWAR